MAKNSVALAAAVAMEDPELAALMARAAAIDPTKLHRFGTELAHAPKASRETLDLAIERAPRRYFHRHGQATTAYKLAVAA